MKSLMKTYSWTHGDVMIVVVAKNVVEARDIVQKRMVLRGLAVPEEVMTEEPDELKPGGIVWCYS